MDQFSDVKYQFHDFVQIKAQNVREGDRIALPVSSGYMSATPIILIPSGEQNHVAFYIEILPDQIQDRALETTYDSDYRTTITMVSRSKGYLEITVHFSIAQNREVLILKRED